MAPQIAAGREAMEVLLEHGVGEGAVFCGCDLIAIGSLEAMAGRRLKVPQKLCIGGFDDIDMLNHLAILLITFRQPIEQMARISFDLLLKRIDNPGMEVSRILLPGDLIVRKST